MDVFLRRRDRRDVPHDRRVGAESSLRGPLLGMCAGAAAIGYLTLALDRLGGLAGLVPPAGLLSLAAGLAGVVLLAVSAYHGITLEFEHNQATEQTDGIVVDAWVEPVGSARSRTRFTVSFTVQDGREIHALCPWPASMFRPEPGQRVTVNYDPAYPGRFDVAEQRSSRWLLTVVPGVVGGVLLLTGLQAMAG